MTTKSEGEHVGQHIDNSTCEECFEFRQQWIHVAGKHAALQSVGGMVRIKAAQFFTIGKDELASSYRRTADELDELTSKASEELQGFIKASTKK